MDRGRLVLQDSLEDLGARFRSVTAGFAAEPAQAIRLPEAWLTPEWNGRTLRFTIPDYTSDEDLSRTLSSLIGSPVHLSTQAMSLRETSKALMRAYRSEARR